MGVSTDAILGWGIAFEEDGGWDYDIAKKVEKKFKGVELFTHCSLDYPMMAIGLCVSRANRGYPVKLDKIEVPKDAAQTVLKALAAYAEALPDGEDEEDEDGRLFSDVKEQISKVTEKDLGWFLCSDMG
jgi:hypothetical protein